MEKVRIMLEVHYEGLNTDLLWSNAWSSTGCLWIYAWNISEAQWPMVWMWLSLTLASARAVAPPDCKEWQCHDSFPMLSPTHWSIPWLHQSHLTDHSRTHQLNWFWSCLTWPIRLALISCEAKSRTLVKWPSHGPHMITPLHHALLWLSCWC